MKPIVTFTMFDPAKRLSLNHRMHWAPRNRIAQNWRRAAEVNARAFGPNALKLPLPPSTVTVTYAVPDRRRRDAGNLAPTTKHIIDGLVDAGWFDDDDHTRIAERNVIEVKPGQPLHVTVTVTPWENQ